MIVAVGPVEDSVSRESGNLDGVSHCGQRAFRIVDDSLVKSFITLDSETQTLSIVPTHNSEVGQWEIDIEVSLVGDPLIKEVTTVTVIVNPCQVTELIGAILEVPIVYPLHTPVMIGALYSFTQTKDCGYVPVIEVIDLPSFVTHNEVDQSFSVESSNPADENTYSISIMATLSVPETYKKETFTELLAVIDFDIEVIDACKTSQLLEILLQDMIISVNGENAVQSLQDIFDEVSMKYGN